MTATVPPPFFSPCSWYAVGPAFILSLSAPHPSVSVVLKPIFLLLSDFFLVGQLARPNPENSRQSPENLAAPTELSLPQLCLAVSAKELVAGVSGRRRERAGTGGGDGEAEAGGGKGVDAEGGQGALFMQRRPLAFFAVDCRPKQQVRG